MSYVYAAGADAALHALGLTKTAAVPPEVLAAMQHQGTMLPKGPGLPRAWSLMGGEGAKLPEWMLRKGPTQIPVEAQRLFQTEADRLLAATPARPFPNAALHTPAPTSTRAPITTIPAELHPALQALEDLPPAVQAQHAPEPRYLGTQPAAPRALRAR